MSPGNLPMKGILFPKIKIKPSTASNKPTITKIFPNPATIRTLKSI